MGFGVWGVRFGAWGLGCEVGVILYAFCEAARIHGVLCFVSDLSVQGVGFTDLELEFKVRGLGFRV